MHLTLLVLAAFQGTSNPDQELFDAIVDADLVKARAAVKRGASLTKQREGIPPLFRALGNPEMFRLLRSLGASIKGVDRYGRTLLHYLASDIPAMNGFTGDYRRIASSGKIDFFTRSDSERTLFAQELLKGGLDPNAKDVAGRTALHYAVAAVDWHRVDMLLNNRWPNSMRRGPWVRVDQADNQGLTPLMYLANSNRGGVVHDSIVGGLLVNAGARLNVKDKQGRTAEDWARIHRRVFLVKLLQESQRNPEGP